MKRNLRLSAITLFFATVIVGCSKDDKTTATGITAAQVNTLIVDGTWDVSLYNEAGVDQVSDFSGYTFDFNADGSLLVTGPAEKTGTWNSTTESGKVKIPIAFETETDGPFESISDDWFVLTATDQKIELKHISGGDGSEDFLTFEKN
ncbi:MAG: hypothetical protein IPN80_03845 [Flavobacterium sp.]|nr:hypothetical protein [Flavobacterium sp.]